MFDVLFQTPIILIYSALFGITMKIADLLNEHGLKWFRGSNVLFGFLWGIFGTLLILSDTIIANICLAVILAFVLRYRIDYLNHGIATTIMFFAFFITQEIIWFEFIFFFIIFALFGLISDHFKHREKPKKIIAKYFRKFTDLRLHYYIFSFIYSIIFNNWLVFFVWALFMLFYEITLRYGMRAVNKQKITDFNSS